APEPEPEPIAAVAPTAQQTPPEPRVQPAPEVTRPGIGRWVALVVVVIVAGFGLLTYGRRQFLRWPGRGTTASPKQGRTLPAGPLPAERNEAQAMADALLGQAMASARTANVKEGLQQAKQALGIYEHARDLAGRAEALTVVGVLYGASGKVSDAAYCYGEAARLRRLLKDDAAAAALLTLEGDVALAAGDAGTAASSYRKALEIRRTMGQTSEQVALMISLSRVYMARRWPPGALDALRRARDLARQMHDAFLEAQILEALAAAYDASGAPVTARGLRASAAALRRNAGQGAAIPMGAGAALAPK
ncbi:MAG: hypothetical protein ACP5VE_00025, partial [Chthonomonadales bacterium]